jgi:hypothetical protein
MLTEDSELRCAVHYIIAVVIVDPLADASQIPELDGSATNHARLPKVKELPRLLHPPGDAAITLASCSQDVSTRPHALGEVDSQKNMPPSANIERREDLCLSDPDDMVRDLDNA